MMRRAGISQSSTSAVLWLMIMLVFLPIAVAHVVARQTVEPSPRAGEVTGTRDAAAPHAG